MYNHYRLEKCELDKILSDLEEQNSKLDEDIAVKNKEWMKKLDFEHTMLERCKEYIDGQQDLIAVERRKVENKTQVRRVSEDVLRLRQELEKAQRE